MECKMQYQNTKYTSHGWFQPRKKVCTKVTYKTVNEHHINKT